MTINSTISNGEKVLEIESLTLRVREIGQSLDWWNGAMIVGLALAAAAAVFVLIATRIVVTRSEQLSKTQDLLGAAKDRQLQADLKAADIRVAGLEQAAVAARTEMAKQETRAAIAERSLLELQARIKPRHMTDGDAKAFIAALESYPSGTVDFGYTSAGGDECFNFAKEFLPLFEKAGWVVRNSASVSNRLDVQVIGVGILVSVPPGSDPKMPPSGYIVPTPVLKALQAAFRTVKIEVQFISWFPGQTAPEVVIGSKPEAARTN